MVENQKKIKIKELLATNDWLKVLRKYCRKPKKEKKKKELLAQV